MTEQQKALYEIAKLHEKQFYNNMVDRWFEDNYRIDRECRREIEEKENDYKSKYGELPKWEYIYDVFDEIKSLERIDKISEDDKS